MYYASYSRLGDKSSAYGKDEAVEDQPQNVQVDKIRLQKDKTQRWMPNKSQHNASALQLEVMKQQHVHTAAGNTHDVAGPSMICSPDLIPPAPVSEVQNITRLKGIDDSILSDLPANPASFSISDSEIDFNICSEPFTDTTAEDAFANYVSDLIQAVVIDSKHREIMRESQEHPLTPTSSGHDGNLQIPPRQLRRQHRNIQLFSPLLTRSRAALSNSFDILSNQ